MQRLRYGVVFLLCIQASGLVAQDRTISRDSSPRQNPAFAKGMAYQISGRHADAILEFQDALHADSSALVLSAISRSYLQLGKLDHALQYAEQAIRNDATSKESWEILAETFIAKGLYEKGVQAYEQILSLHPTERQLFTFGRLLEPTNAKRASEIYELLVRSSPNADIYLRLSKLYKRQGLTQRRISVLEKANQLDRGNPGIISDLIQAYMQAGRFEEAMALAQDGGTTLQEYDGYDRWMCLLRTIYDDSDIVQQMQSELPAVLDKTIALRPYSYNCLLTAGTIALRSNNAQQAEVLLQMAARQSSPYNRFDVILHIGDLCLRMQQPMLASQFLRSNLNETSNPRADMLLGDIRFALHDTVGAITHYTNAVTSNPSLVDAWIQLGILHDLHGDDAQSDAAYRNALALNPRQPVAANNYAFSLVNRGRGLDTAEHLSWTALQAQPGNAAFLDTYAWVMYKSGKMEKAYQYIMLAIQRDGTAMHYEHLGHILNALGNPVGAVEAWETALQMEPQRLYLRRLIDTYR